VTEGGGSYAWGVQIRATDLCVVLRSVAWNLLPITLVACTVWDHLHSLALVLQLVVAHCLRCAFRNLQLPSSGCASHIFQEYAFPGVLTKPCLCTLTRAVHVSCPERSHSFPTAGNCRLSPAVVTGA